jgi:hypothetical protein
MSERRQRSATESLLTVAFGVEMVIVLFGTIAIAGANKQHALEIVIAAILLMGVLALGVATLRRGLNPIVFATQAVLLLPTATEPMWAIAWVICEIFWVTCLVKGRQLDRRKEQS